MKFLSKIFNKRANWAVPYAIFLAIFVALPLVLIVVYAFQDADGAFSFANFTKFAKSPEALNTFIYSIGVALTTTILCIFMLSQAPFKLLLNCFSQRSLNFGGNIKRDRRGSCSHYSTPLSKCQVF